MRTKKISLIALIVGLLLSSVAVTARVQQRDMKVVEQALRDEIPSVVCLNEKFATAGRPRAGAYAKLAQQGFRAVLHLRTAEEGAGEEREQVEQAGLRYLKIPVVSANPNPEKVPEFIKAVKDSTNQPMLIHCAGAQRVGQRPVVGLVIGLSLILPAAVIEAWRIGPPLNAVAQGLAPDDRVLERCDAWRAREREADDAAAEERP